eukprot:snap_masked-scaffold_6-processed-gene-11.18-mRNA-1 protein AED:0.44 eAED:1.00 QI:0/-1/0/1/-1/1/1/0/69
MLTVKAVKKIKFQYVHYLGELSVCNTYITLRTSCWDIYSEKERLVANLNFVQPMNKVQKMDLDFTYDLE